MVDDRDSLVDLRAVMGVRFGVGVRILMTTKWCVDNGPRPVGRGDALKFVWPLTRDEMENIRSVRALDSHNLTNV